MGSLISVNGILHNYLKLLKKYKTKLLLRLHFEAITVPFLSLACTLDR